MQRWVVEFGILSMNRPGGLCMVFGKLYQQTFPNKNSTLICQPCFNRQSWRQDRWIGKDFKMPLWDSWATDALLIEKIACQEHEGEWIVPVQYITPAKLMPKGSKVFCKLPTCVFCHHGPIYLSPFVRNQCSLHLTVLWYIVSCLQLHKSRQKVRLMLSGH